LRSWAIKAVPVGISRVTRFACSDSPRAIVARAAHCLSADPLAPRGPAASGLDSRRLEPAA
jgi:hypothetical protein